ncbi:hypothetical protein RSO01_84010 [Reyranella soli]|uniref:Uncharacterized protein n=1 Tax=Reyranella soli TaxID=1230389 RepID=A0A512NQL0_9HYPH|nr:hypothetical protein RSO01_84010 [Reyranella soli]
MRYQKGTRLSLGNLRNLRNLSHLWRQCMHQSHQAASILARIQRRVGQHRISMTGMRQSDSSERMWEVLP